MSSKKKGLNELTGKINMDVGVIYPKNLSPSSMCPLGKW